MSRSFVKMRDLVISIEREDSREGSDGRNTSSFLNSYSSPGKKVIQVLTQQDNLDIGWNGSAWRSRRARLTPIILNLCQAVAMTSMCSGETKASVWRSIKPSRSLFLSCIFRADLSERQPVFGGIDSLTSSTTVLSSELCVLWAKQLRRALTKPILVLSWAATHLAMRFGDTLETISFHTRLSSFLAWKSGALWKSSQACSFNPSADV